MIVALWNYRSVNRSLEAMNALFPVPHDLSKRWIVSYVTGAVIAVIGFITFLFMLRVI
jgi:hypothetical protein